MLPSWFQFVLPLGNFECTNLAHNFHMSLFNACQILSLDTAILVYVFLPLGNFECTTLDLKFPSFLVRCTSKFEFLSLSNTCQMLSLDAAIHFQLESTSAHLQARNLWGNTMSRATTAQRRSDFLKSRCYAGYAYKDQQEKKNRIGEVQALKEWKELLDMRFSQERNGGEGFVVEIAHIIETKQTPKVLDLSDRATTLKLPAEWCARKCEELKIDPGSECERAMRNVTMKMDEHHRQIMAGHATTHEKQGRVEARLKDIETKMQAGKRGKQPPGAELAGMYAIVEYDGEYVDRKGPDQWVLRRRLLRQLPAGSMSR